MSGGWAIAFVVFCVVTAANSVLLVALARYVGTLAGRTAQPLPLELTSEGPERGSSLAALELPVEMERALAEADGRDTVIALLSSSCPPCTALVGELNRFARDYREVATVTAIAGGGEEPLGMRRALRTTAAVLDPKGAVARAFGVESVPFALMYRDGRLLAKGVANNRDMLAALVAGQTEPEDEGVIRTSRDLDERR
jgi:hypothetical protein